MQNISKLQEEKKYSLFSFLFEKYNVCFCPQFYVFDIKFVQ